MKVLMLDQIASVNYKYSFSLCNELKNQNIDIEMVIDNKENLNECNVKAIKLFNTGDKSVGKISKFINYISTLNKVIKKLKKENYDILHVQWFIVPYLDYKFLKKVKANGIKIVITIHDILPFNEKKNDILIFKKIYGLADEIIVQAESNIKRFSELFPSYSEKVSYIPHGNFIEYTDSYSMEEAKSYLGLPKDKDILLFFGQIKKVKGLGVLIKSFYEVSKEYDNAFLVIAGRVLDDDFEYYNKMIHEYKLEDKVRCDIRYIKDEEIGYYYSASIVNILPYLNIYQSGVIQLAYAYKKPVIASKLPAFESIVKEGVNGYLSEVNDSESLKNAIIKALNNKENLSDMGEKGYKFIKDNYSWNDIAKKLKNIYLKY